MFLEVKKHFVWKQYYLQEKTGFVYLRIGLKCLVEECSDGVNVSRSVYENLGSLLRHCISHPRIADIRVPFVNDLMISEFYKELQFKTRTFLKELVTTNSL